jgi:hypothetical protein
MDKKKYSARCVGNVFARETPLKLLCVLAVLRIGNVFDADPDPTFYFAAHSDPDLDPTLSYPIIQC